MGVTRTTVDLSAYPDLVVIYLGMKALDERGAQTFMALFPEIVQSVQAQPDGLLLHEMLGASADPLPGGIMRQYWRDFESLEAWARTLPHSRWWQNFLKDPGGTQFWHETYFMRGGMEAIYDNMAEEVGFLQFAPKKEARGPMFGARTRLGIPGAAVAPEGAREEQMYGDALHEP